MSDANAYASFNVTSDGDIATLTCNKLSCSKNIVLSHVLDWDDLTLKDLIHCADVHLTAFHSEATATVKTKAIVDRLPCSKCGAAKVFTTMRYCDGVYGKFKLTGDTCRASDGEHFHRACIKCHYTWTTKDVKELQ